MDSIDAIFFDWDGTLVDSAQMAYCALRKSLGILGIVVERSLYERAYSPDWYAMYEAFGLPREKWQEADDLWLQHYGRNPPDAAPGAPGVLRELGRRGYCLGIVSSGARSRVCGEIEALGLNGTFQVVVCGEDVGNRKPHPEGLERAMTETGRAREVCCYVGDTPEDMEMGKRAHVRTIGIPSRYPNSRTLVRHGPDLCIESITELLTHFTAPISRSSA